MTKYRLKYNFLIPIFRLTLIALFVSMIGLIFKGINKNGLHFDLNLVGLMIYVSIPTFLLYRLLRRLLTESNLIKLENGKIEIYNFIKFKKSIYKTTDCLMFHSYRIPFDLLILKLPTGTYIHILSYDYFDFNKLQKIFIENGITNAGFLSDTTI